MPIYAVAAMCPTCLQQHVSVCLGSSSPCTFSAATIRKGTAIAAVTMCVAGLVH